MIFDPRTKLRTWLHYDPTSVYYALTEDELNRLGEAGQNLWKDVCLVSFSLGLPCLLNAITDSGEPFTLTLGLFLNYLFAVVGLALSLIFGIAWYRSQRRVNSIMKIIKDKPRLPVKSPGMIEVSPSPSRSPSASRSPSESPSASVSASPSPEDDQTDDD